MMKRKVESIYEKENSKDLEIARIHSYSNKETLHTRTCDFVRKAVSEREFSNALETPRRDRGRGTGRWC